MEPENKIKPTRSEIKSPAIIETYADDMAEVLENDTEGLVKKIIQEEEGHEAEKKNLSPESNRNKIFMLAGAVLVLASVAILFFFVLNKNKDTVLVQKQFVPPIFNEKTTLLEVGNLKKEQIAQTVLNEVNATEVKSGGVEGIYLSENKQLIGLRRFLSLAGSSFAPGDDTFFVKDSFLMGVVNVKAGDIRAPGEGFFILLEVRSTADVFDALRDWEGKIFSDLHGFLGIPLSSDTGYLLNKSFVDGIIENKNARILYDNDGKIVLAYIFTSDTSVTITNSAEATHEIVLRLTSASQKH
ncbi:MAG: hypothetical protein WC609_01725 [Candidatus Paceibacterota bacterium]|jgi:hypothetical protein